LGQSNATFKCKLFAYAADFFWQGTPVDNELGPFVKAMPALLTDLPESYAVKYQN
jgi:hypothetical protein